MNEKFMPMDQQSMMAQRMFESCVTRSLMSCAAGAALGVVWGLFTSGFETPLEETRREMAGNPMSSREKIREHMKETGIKMRQYGRGFAVVGFLFAGSECVIEKYRGRADLKNGVYAGCFAGAFLAGKAGPVAMGAGCAGFSAFSYAIDAFTDRY
eukprot:GFYU01011360.1.p2 GENE.GFYU01011360.1~~GFYU01011360.1.p2  ORF type:complete len:155 (+),score=37.04 GFYU01011360.1:94-558(+)